MPTFRGMSSAITQAAWMHGGCLAVALVAFGASASPVAAALLAAYATLSMSVLMLAEGRGLRPSRRVTTLLALESMVLAGVCGSLGFVPARSFAVLFVLTFVWLGLHQPPRLALRLLPIAVVVYVAAALLGAGDSLDLREVLLMAGVSTVACAAVGNHVQRADATAAAFRLVSEVVSGLPGASHVQVLDRVVGAVTGLGYDGGSLSVIDRRAKAFRVEHAVGVAEATRGVHSDRSGLSAEVRDAGSPIVVADYQRSVRAVPAVVAAGLRTCVGVPVFAHGDLAGVLIACQTRVRRIHRSDVDALVLLASAAGKAIEAARALSVEQQLTRRLQQISETDPLTGVTNRRGASPMIESLTDGDSVAMIDLDHFKRVNDESGHQAGDRTLVALAAHLQSLVRRTDHVVRFGGEEFLVILPDTPIAAAAALMDRIRATWAVTSPQATMSVGVAGFERNGMRTIAAADRAMYAAKDAGRNTVVTVSRRPEHVGR